MAWPDLLQYILLALVGVVSGFINTVGGGGALISMPLLIFMGLPATVANGTTRVAVLIQSILAAKGFQHKGVTLPLPYTYWLSVTSLVGGLIGVWLAIIIPDSAFSKILAVVMVLALGSVLIKPAKGSQDGKERMSMARQIWGNSIFFLLGIYGGFLQAGSGFLVIATLSHLHNFTLVKSNYIKVFTAILYTGASIIIFALAGKVVWIMAITLALGQGMGGWYASRWSVDKGDKWIRRILIILIVPMAIKLWFF